MAAASSSGSGREAHGAGFFSNSYLVGEINGVSMKVRQETGGRRAAPRGIGWIPCSIVRFYLADA